jgi:uncharacterized protein with PQ loop repeat
MSMITQHDGYEYAAVVCGSIFLLPQLHSAIKTHQLRHVSGASLMLILVGSVLWGFYMYESNLILYASLSGFVCLQAAVIFMLKIVYYYQRVNKHMRSFDAEDEPPDDQV